MRVGWSQQYAPFGWRPLALLAVFLLSLTAGCARGGGEPLSQWTLEAKGVTPRQVQLPVHLDEQLPQRRLSYRLSRTVRLRPDLVGRDLGVVAYRLLADKPPHLGAPLLARLSGREIAPVPPLASERPDLPAELARALDACLAVEPGERPGVDPLRALFEDTLAQLSRVGPGRARP